MSETVVTVSRHAREQAADRAGLDEHVVCEQVGIALVAGRTSRLRPAFLGPGSEARHGALWCWNEDSSVAFVVVASRGGARVVTTLIPDKPVTAVAAAFARARARARVEVIA